MTIHVRHVHIDPEVCHTTDIPEIEDHYIITIAGAESEQAFKILVRRALNTWPDAHPDLKELGDMLDHGRVLQDYQVQRTDRRN